MVVGSVLQVSQQQIERRYMRIKKQKLSKAALREGTSYPSDLPEFLYIALEEEDDEECECAVCEGDDEKNDCKSPKKYLPEIVKDVKRMKTGTLVGVYRLVARHKVDVVLVDVDNKGNKLRR